VVKAISLDMVIQDLREITPHHSIDL